MLNGFLWKDGQVTTTRGGGSFFVRQRAGEDLILQHLAPVHEADHFNQARHFHRINSLLISICLSFRLSPNGLTDQTPISTTYRDLQPVWGILNKTYRRPGA